MSLFTKRHYEWLANQFNQAMPEMIDNLGLITPKGAQWNRTVNQIAKALAADNSNFKSLKFITACNKKDTANDD